MTAPPSPRRSTPPACARGPRPRLTLAALGVSVVAVAAFAPSLRNGFIFDDFVFLKYGCWQILEWSQLGGVPADGACHYRPLRYLSLAIDHLVWGRDPFGYHLTNLALHGITSVFAFAVAFRLARLSSLSDKGRFAVAAVAALLWAAHPVHVDSVAYVSGRRDLLTTLFYLAAFTCLPSADAPSGGAGPPAKWRTGLRLVGAALLFWLAFMSKEMAVTFPVVAALYYATRRWSLTRDGLRKALPLLALGSVIAAAFGAWVVANAGSAVDTGLHGATVLQHVLTIPVIYLKYLQILLVPAGLWGDYQSFPLATGLGDLRVWLGAAAWLSLVGAALAALSRGARDVAAGLGWFLVTLLPVSQLVPHHELMAEHYLYLPSLGLFVALCGVAARAVSARGLSERSVGVVVAACVGLLVLRTHDRIEDYSDGEAFALSVLAQSPDAVRVRLGLSDALQARGELDRAIQVLGEALSVVDDGSVQMARVLQERAAVYAMRGDLDEAARDASRVLEMYPTQAETIAILGTIRARQGRQEEAVALLRTAVEMRPGSAQNELNLAVALSQSGELAEAERHFAEAVRLGPLNPVAQLQFAEVAYRQRRIEDAIARYERLLELVPDDRTAHARLTELYARAGDAERSAMHRAMFDAAHEEQ